MDDLVGQRFGKLVVLAYEKGAVGIKARWRCRCDCGREVSADAFRLRNGNKKSCGCAPLEGRLARARERSEEVEKRRLIADDPANNGLIGDGLCMIKGCDDVVRGVGFCGHHYDMWQRYGHPLAGALFTTKRHSMTFRGKERKIYLAMKRRCLNPNCADYLKYGGRGIEICDRWLVSFENFYADMGACPPGGSIEREDVNGNYEPGNCRWATAREQNRNTRATRLTAEFVAQAKRRYADGATVAQIARDGGFPYFTVYQALTGISWNDIEAAGHG